MRRSVPPSAGEERSTSGLKVVVATTNTHGLADVLAQVATVLPAAGAADADVIPLLEDADAIVSARFSCAMAAAAPRLRLVHTPGAGTDGIDLAAVPTRATVCNVFGHEAAIAEYALMAMLALNRELFKIDRALRQSDWGDRAPQRELRGRTLAIVGLGHIGAQIARYAGVLGMTVTGITRSPHARRRDELGLARLGGMADLPVVLADADFVVLAVPLTADTNGLIGERELRAMKPTAYLINVARGGIVDERALYHALKERTIAGAAIDVWYHYPATDELCAPAIEPFHELDNVIMTPHVAGWTDGTARYRGAEIADNLRRLAMGKPLLNVVKPATTVP
jgi:phosphoglycerate dehydrogenase-like enzyme